MTKYEIIQIRSQKQYINNNIAYQTRKKKKEKIRIKPKHGPK